MSLYVPVNVLVKEFEGIMTVKKWLVDGKISEKCGQNDAKSDARNDAKK